MSEILTEAGFPARALPALVLALTLALFALIRFLCRKGLPWTPAVLGAMLAGWLLGLGFPDAAGWIRPIGTVYVGLLNAVVMPLVAVCVADSVLAPDSVKRLKGIGLKSLFWLLLTTALAIALSLGLGPLLDRAASAAVLPDSVKAEPFRNKTASFASVLTGLFPNNLAADFANQKIVPVILASAAAAVFAVSAGSENRAKILPFRDLVAALKEILMRAVDFIIGLTPYAVLVLAADSAASAGGLGWADLAAPLGFLAVTFLALVLDVFVLDGLLVFAFAKLNPVRFFKKIFPAQAVAFSTQSSTGTLPVTLDVLVKKIGVSPEIANFTAPLGTTVGMPGCAGIWPVLTVLFGARILGWDYGPKEYAALAVISLFVSLGTAGVPGTATVAAASVLTAVGMPLEVLVLTIPVSALADTGRTVANVTAAMTAAAVVARSENALDDAIFDDLKSYHPPETEIPDGPGANI